MNRSPRHDPVERLNKHHADDLLVIARAFGGQPEATAARAVAVDAVGIELAVDTPQGSSTARVDFIEPVAAGPRRSVIDLARRARAALATTEDTAP